MIVGKLPMAIELRHPNSCWQVQLLSFSDSIMSNNYDSMKTFIDALHGKHSWFQWIDKGLKNIKQIAIKLDKLK